MLNTHDFTLQVIPQTGGHIIHTLRIKCVSVQSVIDTYTKSINHQIREAGKFYIDDSFGFGIYVDLNKFDAATVLFFHQK